MSFREADARTILCWIELFNLMQIDKSRAHHKLVSLTWRGDVDLQVSFHNDFARF